MCKPYLHCLALSFLFVTGSFAQQNPAPALSPRPESVPAASQRHIKLDVVVTDKSGKPVTGLEQSDFTLLDNNQPSKILSFQTVDGTVQKSNPPVEVILVLDTINLGIQQVAFVRDEMEKFLRQNGGHLAQPVSLFVITDQVLDAQRQPSRDGNALAEDIKNLDNHLRTIGRSAGGWGATERFDISIKMFMNIADFEAKKPGKKLLIWTGAGWPEIDSSFSQISSRQQQQTFDEIVLLSTKLRKARVSVYSISQGVYVTGTTLYELYLKGVKTADKVNLTNLDLKVLAVQSGGLVLGPGNDLTAQIDRSVEDAKTFYTLSFDPPRADGPNEYHDLKVQIDKPRLTARTSTGYYNQPDAAPGPANDPAASDLDSGPVAALAGKPVTVAQLEQALNDAHRQPDAETARQLSGLVLTERLSSAKLSALKAGRPGPKAQQALVALADTSAFLNPPSAEIPADAAPDLTEQRRIMAQAID